MATAKSPPAQPGNYLSRNRSALLCAVLVFMVAAGARLTFLALRGTALSPDSADYIRLAENIRVHGVFSLDAAPPFTPTIRRPPLYPLFMAVLPVSESALVSWTALIQTLLDCVTALMVFLLALWSLNLRWATATGLAYAVFPGALHYSTTILSEPLFTALLVGGVLVMVSGFSKDRLILTGLGGLLLGLATLCRSVALPLPAIFAAVSFLAPGASHRRLLRGLTLIASAALVVAPWSVRTTRVSNQLVLIQGATAVNFYITTRTEWDQKDQESLWKRFVEEDPYGRRLAAARTPAEVLEADRFGFQLGMQNIRSNPTAYFASRLKAIPYLFISSFDSFTGINSSFRTLWDQRDVWRLTVKVVLLLLFSLVPLLLALIGLIPSRRVLPAMLVAAVWLYLLAANLPLWVEYRFWFPAVPFLFISAALGAKFLVQHFRR